VREGGRPMSDYKTILLIDGHDKERQFYAKSLKALSPDYVILEAATAPSGLELYNSHSIDCVVIELELSDMSGFEVLAQLIPIAKHPTIAVVVLTRLPYASLLVIAKESGAHEALPKATTSGEILHQAIIQAVAMVSGVGGHPLQPVPWEMTREPPSNL
jgi:DNA-binding NarL/FixJ family response regulator